MYSQFGPGSSFSTKPPFRAVGVLPAKLRHSVPDVFGTWSHLYRSGQMLMNHWFGSPKQRRIGHIRRQAGQSSVPLSQSLSHWLRPSPSPGGGWAGTWPVQLRASPQRGSSMPWATWGTQHQCGQSIWARYQTQLYHNRLDRFQPSGQP